MLLQIKKLRPDAIIPRYMSNAAAGLDLAAAIDGPLIFEPGQRAAVGTGLAIALPAGYEGQVRPRSGLALKQGLTLVNGPGTIDADYRGEVKILLINLGEEPVVVEAGQRIAQLVVAPVVRSQVVEVKKLPSSERGAGGFGSTGDIDHWSIRFMQLAEHVAGWSKDPSTQTGCVIVDSSHRVVGLGYNGFPRGVDDSVERYTNKNEKYKLIVHAETNAISNASKPVVGCTLYTIMYPCSNCAKAIIQSGIIRVFTPLITEREPWCSDAQWSMRMFAEAKVEVVYWPRR
jgi:dUTP pyrophosphatase